MKRKIVQTGGSLAVTLPRDVIEAFQLKKGDTVDVSVHPQTGAITIRPGILYIEGGTVTPRFLDAAERVGRRYDTAFQRLADARSRDDQ